MGPGLYIAATQQHGGKTLVALGLIQALVARGLKVGYMKPVGQRYVQYGQHRIDEDAVLIEETYHLGCEPPYINPVTIPRGFTAKYIDHPDPASLEKAILEGYEQVSAGKDLVVLEGTGHAGVGSVIDLSNARVAQLLNAPAVTVTCAGVGRPIDEFVLGANLFKHHGVAMAGAILNRGRPDKLERIADTLRRGLAHKGYELLGSIARDQRLESIPLGPLAEHLDAEVIAGEDSLDEEVSHGIIGSMSTQRALRQFAPGTLAVISGDRAAMIHAALLSRMFADDENPGLTAICITAGADPDPKTRRLLEKSAVPVFRVHTGAFETASKIADYVPKIRPQDHTKIEIAQQLVNEYVDLDRILQVVLDRRVG